MKRVAIIFLLVPNLVLADLGSEMNALLESFFGAEKTENVPEIPVKKEAKFSNNLESKLKEIENFSGSEIQKKIFELESDLADFESKNQQLEREIWAASQSNTSAENDLFLLDQQIELSDKKRKQWQEKKESFENILQEITLEKSAIQALLRVEEKEMEKFLIKNFIREKNANFSSDFLLLKWLLSSETVAQILQDRRRNRILQEQKRERISDLEKLKKILSNREKSAAKLLKKTKQYEEAAAQETRNLKSFAAAKAELASRMEMSEFELARALERSETERLEASIFLQNLHTALKNSDEKVDHLESKNSEIQLENQPFLDFPLDEKFQKITATFRDPEYEKKFGREHLGVDFWAPQGSPIYAPRAAKVEKVASNGLGYSYVILNHGDEFFTIYGHVSEILVEPNQNLERGEIFARTGGTPGTTGAGFLTTGPHLHFEVFEDQNFQNPLLYLPKIAE